MKRKSFISFLLLFLFLSQASTVLAQHNEVLEKVDEYINAYMQMDQFSGSILIAKKGEILVNKGYGFADAEFGVKNNHETKFRIGSLTKAFTAVAILQLEEKGLLKVDDKLQKYISDYPRGDEITVKNLLTHTSGIPNHTEFEDFNKERRVYKYNIVETISTFKNKPLEFNPDLLAGRIRDINRK